MASPATPVTTIEGRTLYATPTGLKVGSKGKVAPAGELLAQLPKGEARQVRKALRRAGHAAKAAAIRILHAGRKDHFAKARKAVRLDYVLVSSDGTVLPERETREEKAAWEEMCRRHSSI